MTLFTYDVNFVKSLDELMRFLQTHGRVKLLDHAVYRSRYTGYQEWVTDHYDNLVMMKERFSIFDITLEDAMDMTLEEIIKYSLENCLNGDFMYEKKGELYKIYTLYDINTPVMEVGM